MPILVPRHIVQEVRRGPVDPVAGVYYGLNELTGKTVAPATLIQSLSKLRRSDVIRWVAAVALWTSKGAELDPDKQKAMADVMLAEELRKSLTAKLRKNGSENWCIFHRRQLLFLLRMAVVTCSEDTQMVEDDLLRWKTGECCLMANDLLDQLENFERNSLVEGEENRWMTGVVISFLERRNREELLARAQSFWFDLPKKSNIQQRFAKRNMPDFESAFATKYGIKMREFFLIICSLYLGFETHASRNNNPLLLDEEPYLTPGFARGNVRKVLSHISQTPDELAISLLAKPRQNWATDCTELQEHPIIQVFEGKLACPDLDLLRRSLVDRIYFLLQKAYPDGAFRELFGYVFEEYINTIVRRFSYEGKELVRTFYSSPRFEGKRDEAGDGILVWPRAALVMEYKARQLTTRERYSGLTNLVVAGVEDITGKEGTKKGVFQLAKVIKRLLEGENIVSGSRETLSLSNHPLIHPVLITYEEAMGLESVRQHCQEKFSSALQIESEKRKQIGELLVLTIEEIEILERLALKDSPETILQEYVAYLRAHQNDRAGSFHSFVCSSRFNRNPPPLEETLVGNCYKEAMRQIGQEIKQRGTS